MFRLQSQYIKRWIAVENIVVVNSVIKNDNFNSFRNKSVFRHYSNKKEEYESNNPNNAMKWTLLVMPIAAFGLGCWQVKRKEWKLNLIKTLETNTKETPVELPEDFRDLADLEYHPVKVYGHFLHDREILMGPRSFIEQDSVSPQSGSFMSNPHTNQGWLVITPFQLHDKDYRILVNRGWIPCNLKNASSRPEGQIEGEIELVGIVRLEEKRPNFVPSNKPLKGEWFYRDLNQMGQLTDSAPVWLDARGNKDMPKGWPIPNQTRISLRNEHTSYITTWFGLSAVTSIMWFRKFILKLPMI